MNESALVGDKMAIDEEGQRLVFLYNTEYELDLEVHVGVAIDHLLPDTPQQQQALQIEEVQ